MGIYKIGDIAFLFPSEEQNNGNANRNVEGVYHIFEMIKKVHLKDPGNIEKLKNAITDEKYLFISVTAGQPEAANYLNCMGIEKGIFSAKKLLAQELRAVEIIPNEIDVIWVATLFSSDENGGLGYTLAKIYKDQSRNIVFEPIFPKVMAY
jgi:hypothetical protein